MGDAAAEPLETSLHTCDHDSQEGFLQTWMTNVEGEKMSSPSNLRRQRLSLLQIPLGMLMGFLSSLWIISLYPNLCYSPNQWLQNKEKGSHTRVGGDLQGIVPSCEYQVSSKGHFTDQNNLSRSRASRILERLFICTNVRNRLPEPIVRRCYSQDNPCLGESLSV